MSVRSSLTRILVVIKSDGVGGVERRVANLLDACARREIAFDLVALAGAPVSQRLLASRDVRVLESRLPSLPLRQLHQLAQLRSQLRRHHYDLVLAFGPSPNVLVSLACPGRTAAVISENGNPFVPRRRLWNATMMWLYRRADALLVQTDRLAEDIRATGRAPKAIAVSPAMLAAQVSLVPPSTARKPMIVSVGRFVPSKRLKDLVAAFASIADRFPEWKLSLVGDGSERPALERQVTELGLSDRVVFTGLVQAPWRLLSTSSIFVLCSAHEGFPNVLIEAVASGCALVSSDCKYGPRELLHHGERGLLYPVGDVAQLANHLARLLGDPETRHSLAARAHDSVKPSLGDASGGAFLEILSGLVKARQR